MGVILSNLLEYLIGYVHGVQARNILVIRYRDHGGEIDPTNSEAKLYLFIIFNLNKLVDPNYSDCVDSAHKLVS